MFGSFRQMMGGNFQGDAMAVSQAFQKSLRTGIAYSSVNGNVPLSKENDKEYAMVRSEHASKKRARIELMYLPSSYLLILDDLLLGQHKFFP